SARDNCISKTLPFGSVFLFLNTPATAGPQSIALAVETKNSPPDCFLNASTVLKEIICLYSTPLLIAKVFVFLRVLRYRGPQKAHQIIKAFWGEEKPLK
ncbi:MAG: hypothetical protein IKN26_03855, partial [Eubacterium sp.]|nr:hypothetical protein [Eubacterium sp.]